MRTEAPPGRPAGRMFAIVFIAAVAAYTALAASMRLYPSVDVPNHLAAATIARYGGDPGNRLAEFFSVTPGLRPNAAHMVFCGIRLFGSVESANRWFFGVYALLLPIAVLALVHRYRGDPWVSLLSLLLLFNYNVHWGFVNFFIGIPAVLFVLLLFSPGPPLTPAVRLPAVSALLVLLFFMHALLALFAVLLVAVLGGCRAGRRPIGWIREGAPLVPVLVLLAAWWATDPGNRGQSTVEYLAAYYRDDYLPSLPDRVRLMTFDNEHLFAGWIGVETAVLFSLVAVAPLVVGLAVRRARDGESPPEGRPVPRDLKAFAACALGCFLLLPAGLPEQKFLYERFSVLVLLATVLAGSVLAHGRLRTGLRTAIVTVCAAHLALYTGYFRAFQADNRGFVPSFLEPASSAEPLVGLIYDRDYRGKPVYIHFPNYHTVWRRGIAATKVGDYRYGTVRRKAGTDRLPEYVEWIPVSAENVDRYPGAGSLLVRGRVPEVSDDPMTRFELRATSLSWSLYTRKEPFDARP